MSTGDAGLVGDLVVGHTAHTPAVWLVLAVAALLYGAAPRALPAVWLLVGHGVLVGFFAPLLDLPAGVVRLSPFEHVGEYPLDDIAAAAVLTLTACAAAVAAVALGAFRRRDLATT
jgi:ABC-2 type transport system permease protein